MLVVRKSWQTQSSLDDMPASIAITESCRDVMLACFKTVWKEYTRIFPTGWSTRSHKVKHQIIRHSTDTWPTCHCVKFAGWSTVESHSPPNRIVHSINLYNLSQSQVQPSPWSAGCDTNTLHHTVHKSGLGVRRYQGTLDHAVTTLSLGLSHYLPWAQCHWAIS